MRTLRLREIEDMIMLKLIQTPGVLAAVLTVAALVATALGKTGLATFLGSPEAATAVQGAIASVGALVAGVLGGVNDKPSA